jgi:membrane-bound lytic murein transglycosylase B
MRLQIFPETRRYMSKSFVIYFILVTLFLSGCGYAAPPLAEREDIKGFIDKMVAVHEFKREELVRMFNQVNLKDGIIRAITRPAEAKPWYLYRQLFITDRQIDDGVEFWSSNAPSLTEAEQQYGVPAEIIVAILGVETGYGTNKGSYRVIDALSTLAFDYPKRSEFFLKELKHFLILCREESMDPLQPVGSYAGAMGIPQFMPSSYRNYAKDQDHDGRRDIWKNNRDAIASVANYFNQHGWIKGGSVTFRAVIEGNEFQKLISSGLETNTDLRTMQASGIKIPAGIDLDQQARLLQLENEYGPSFWVTLANFYVITRYNHSALYAMAVYQLSREILYKKRYQS